ncbi:cell differentiation protein rcd1 like protein [Trichuris trichiura]|uniref:CCR4-NOT transcription complex subunit 9 n=1 Tax=Trichuris trichiura TaxID=36087 RepID=A0A077ZQB5_TRITR|nr:cell differentiation protein rcd1 like protein [Trichuris trichiura]
MENHQGYATRWQNKRAFGITWQDLQSNGTSWQNQYGYMADRQNLRSYARSWHNQNIYATWWQKQNNYAAFWQHPNGYQTYWQNPTNYAGNWQNDHTCETGLKERRKYETSWNDQREYATMPFEPEAFRVSDRTSTALIKSLLNPETKNDSLWKLAAWQKNIPDLPLKLWNTPHVVTSLLIEICSFYEDVQNRRLTKSQSKMLCYIIELINCIGGHPVTRMLCLQINLPDYLLPFMSFVPNDKIYEKPCALCLNVLSTLLRANEQETVDYVLKMDCVNICLHTMHYGSVYLKTAGVYTMLNFLATDLGFAYVVKDVSQTSKIIQALGQ